MTRHDTSISPLKLEWDSAHRRLMLLVLLTTLVALSLSTVAAAEPWWRTETDPASPAWWTLDDSMTPDQLRRAWTGLDTRAADLQNARVAAVEADPAAAKSLPTAVSIDGAVEPQLIPLWRAFALWAADIDQGPAGAFDFAVADLEARGLEPAAALAVAEIAERLMTELRIEADARVGVRGTDSELGQRSPDPLLRVSVAALKELTATLDDPSLGRLRRHLQETTAPRLRVVVSAAAGDAIEFEDVGITGEISSTDNTIWLGWMTGSARYLGQGQADHKWLQVQCLANDSHCDDPDQCPDLDIFDLNEGLTDYYDAGRFVLVEDLLKPNASRVVSCYGTSIGVKRCQEDGGDVELKGRITAFLTAVVTQPSDEDLLKSPASATIPCLQFVDVRGDIDLPAGGYVAVRLQASGSHGTQFDPRYEKEQTVTGEEFSFADGAPVEARIRVTIVDAAEDLDCSFGGDLGTVYDGATSSDPSEAHQVPGIVCCPSDAKSQCGGAADYAVGGPAIDGLEDGSVTLRMSGTENGSAFSSPRTVSAGTSSWQFPRRLADGTRFNLAVTAKPSYHQCFIRPEQGQIDGADFEVDAFCMPSLINPCDFDQELCADGEGAGTPPVPDVCTWFDEIIGHRTHYRQECTVGDSCRCDANGDNCTGDCTVRCVAVQDVVPVVRWTYLCESGGGGGTAPSNQIDGPTIGGLAAGGDWTVDSAMMTVSGRTEGATSELRFALDGSVVSPFHFQRNGDEYSVVLNLAGLGEGTHRYEAFARSAADERFFTIFSADFVKLAPSEPLALAHGGQSIPWGSTFDLGTAQPGAPHGRNLRLSSSTAGPVTVSAITIEGGELEIDDHPTLPAAVGPGEDLYFTVRFRGQGSGEIVRPVRIVHDAGAVLSFDARVVVTPHGLLRVELDGTPLTANAWINFGVVPSGQTIDRAFVLRNVGDATLNLGPTWLGGLGTDFDWVTQPPTSIPPGGSAQAVIQALSTGVPVAERAVVFNHDGPLPGSQFRFFVRRELDTSPELRVELGGVPVAADAWIDFGVVPAGQTVDRTFVLRNVGNATLNLGPTWLGGLGTDFDWVVQPPTSIPPGGSAQTVIRALSTGVDLAERAVVFNHDGPVPGSQFRFFIRRELDTSAELRVELGGVPIAADTWIDFGVVPSGQVSDRTFVLRNVGDATLHLGPTWLGGFPTEFTWVVPPPSAISPGAAAAMTIRALANGATTAERAVVLNHNAPVQGSQFRFFIRRMLEFDAAAIDAFDIPTEMTCGETAVGSITFRNTGTTTWTRTGALGGYKLGWGSDDADPFTDSPRVWLLPGEEVAPGTSRTFAWIMTAPAAAGSYATDWQLIHEGVGWFGPAVQRTVAVACPAS